MIELAIGVFTRLPEPGQTKTRLVPALGAQGAADLHRHMLEKTLQVAACTGAVVTLWVTESPAHSYFLQLATQYGCAVKQQQGADLGQRMLRALTQMHMTSERALLIGSDCLLHDEKSLLAAAARLANHAMVFTPAHDGGYVLVGARDPCAQAFAGIDWGTAAVMAQTRARLTQAQVVWAEQPALWDIDTPDDVERARQAGLL
jgi:uncharacterized protein